MRQRLDEHHLRQLPERLLREDLRPVCLQLLCLIRQPAEAVAVSAPAVLRAALLPLRKPLCTGISSDGHLSHQGRFAAAGFLLDKGFLGRQLSVERNFLPSVYTLWTAHTSEGLHPCMDQLHQMNCNTSDPPDASQFAGPVSSKAVPDVKIGRKYGKPGILCTSSGFDCHS